MSLFVSPPPELAGTTTRRFQGADHPLYRELISVEGRVVGYVCRECGRLYRQPHFEACSQSLAERGMAAISKMSPADIALFNSMTADQISILLRYRSRPETGAESDPNAKEKI